MSTKIGFLTRQFGESQVSGSDGRLDVSARNNLRSYYISRDDGQAYTLGSEVSGAVTDDIVLYWQNTTTVSRILFIDQVLFNSSLALRWEVLFVTGTAAGGSSLAPVNLNKTSSNPAQSNSRGNGVITGLTEGDTVSFVRSPVSTCIVESFDDTLILGQNDALAIKVSSAAGATDVEVTVRGFYEVLDI